MKKGRQTKYFFVLRFAVISFVAGSVLLLQSCGLPTISFLVPPIALSPSGTNEENYTLRFQHDGENDGDDFRGYELYYKLYYPGDPSITNDETYIEATPKVAGPGRLEARQFLRLAPTRMATNDGTPITVSDDAAPLIDLAPTGTAVEFALDLQSPDTRGIDDAQTHIVAEWSAGADAFRLELRRRSTQLSFVSNPLDDYAGFWDASAYLDGDYDVSQMLASQALPMPVGNLRIVIYVLAYGIDANDFNPYYSEPVRLEPAVLVTG